MSNEMIVENIQDEQESNAEYYFNKLAEYGILENIFSKVIFRRSLSLVNKLFYKTVCKVDNSKDIFRARFEQDQIVWHDGYPSDNIYKSVYCSKRVLTEIYFNKIYLVDIIGDVFEANYEQCVFLIAETIRKISGSLKKFTINSCILTENQLMKILDSLNKNSLKELNIIDVGILHEKHRKFKKTLTFPSLEKLDLTKTRYGNPDPKESINENNDMYSFLKSIGENSPFLQDLSIHESLINRLDIGKLKLKRLYVERAFPAHIRLAAIVSQHTNYLTMVDFLNCYVMEDVLNEILQAQNLTSLKINMDGISLKGFMNISNLRTLTELGFKCSNSCKWIISAMAMHTLGNLKSIYLDIKDLDVNIVDLSRMLNKNIPHFHVVASQSYILGSLFSSTYIAEMVTCTVELYVNGYENSQLLVFECCSLQKLKEFSLINRNPTFCDFECHLELIIGKCMPLKKLRIEGFIVNVKLFEIALKDHYFLEELYLINAKSVDCDFVFDRDVSKIIEVYGKKLKILEITCAKSKLKRSKQFPFILRRGSLKIFRYR